MEDVIYREGSGGVVEFPWAWGRWLWARRYRRRRGAKKQKGPAMMSQFTSSGFARLVLVTAVVLAVGGLAYAGDDANDWVHTSFGTGTGEGYSPKYDLEKKPVTGNVVGVACTRYLSAGCAEHGTTAHYHVEYWEFDGSGPIGGAILDAIPPAALCGAIALAYTSDGYPAVTWATNALAAWPNGSSSVFYSRELPGGAWTSPLCLQTYDGYGVSGNFAWLQVQGIKFVELAFDKRSGCEDEIHIVYGGVFDYQTPAEYDQNIDPFSYLYLYGLHKMPNGPWPSEPQEIDTHSGASAGSSFYASLATSEWAAPQLAYEDLELVSTINFTTFTTRWPVGSAILAGSRPSLALDPTTGDPRIAYSTGSGVYLAQGNPLTSVLVDSGAGGFVSLAIEPYGNVDMRLVADTGVEGVNAYECVAGVWSLMSPYGQVTYNGSDARIALAPGLTTDPWVLVVFDDELGLAQYGSVIGGCGSAPVARGGSVLPSAGKALVPLLAAFGALAVWYGARRRRRALQS